MPLSRYDAFFFLFVLFILLVQISPILMASDSVGNDTYVQSLRLRLQTFGSTPIYLATRNGHEKVVEVLVKAGADVNAAYTVRYFPQYALSCAALRLSV
jgi:hypothetical protein